MEQRYQPLIQKDQERTYSFVPTEAGRHLLKKVLEAGCFGCPECDVRMRVVCNDTKPLRPELYCEACHVSLRLW